MREQWKICLGLMVLMVMILPGQDLTPRLIVGKANETEVMVLEELSIQVEIVGVISETRLTMTFFNPHDRVMEGELTFPLPKGAQVSGYALDVNGRLVDGVAVEKEKARKSFEAEVRKGIDPGIVERLAGNHFRTRVYPLPAKGRRTVMVRYLSELSISGETPIYRLPLSVNTPLKQFSFQADVLGDRGEPTISESPLDGLSFVNWRHAFRAEKKAENVLLKGTFSLKLPKLGKGKLFVQKSPEGAKYFYAWQRLAPRKKADSDRKTSRLTIFWDASGSRSNQDHESEYAFLRAWFAGQTHPVSVRLLPIRNRLEAPRLFKSVRDAEELIAHLKTVYYDGGTNLVALGEEKEPSDLAFLFSDGLGNFETDGKDYKAAPLFTIASDRKSDFSRMRLLAIRGGGDLVDLQVESPSEAVERIGRPLTRFLGSSGKSRGVAQVYPALPAPVGAYFVLAGVVENEALHLELNFGGKGMEEEIATLGDQVEVLAEGTMLETFWAMKKIEELMLEEEKKKSAILETGKQFGLVTSQTSLIVLERLEQYLEHRIEPPQTLPQMRQEYLRRQEQAERRRKEGEKSKMNRVMAMWQERLKWFHTDFSTLPAAGQKKEKIRDRDGLQLEESVAPQHARQSMGAEPMPVVARTAASAVPADAKGEAKSDHDAPFLVKLKPFDPKTPYLDSLKKAQPKDFLEVYLSMRERYGDSPSFFVDCAQFFFDRKMKALGLQVLSNLAELRLEDARLLRILAGRLADQGELKLARLFYETVLEIRSEEPQSCRDLALVLAELKEYRRAVALLNKVIFTDWDRFNGIEVVALMELNEILFRARLDGVNDLPVSPAFAQLIDTDLRIVLSWDADATDIDLHVLEPTGEEVYYSHKLSSSGGLVSNDFTQGYGPEEFVVRKAIPGRYIIRAKYFGSSAQSLLGPVTVRVDIFTRFGRKAQQKRTVFLRLEEAKEMLDVAEVEMGRHGDTNQK